jgi:CRISPR/Cas system-associated exonuclease Cas4 (RecB family)
LTLPKGFLFSQSNLQDYVDCQRRFQLRHMLHLSWPAVEAEPIIDNERMMNQGSQFHKSVHQHLIGVPGTRIESSMTNDEVMLQWWRNYQNSIKDGILELIDQDGNKHFEEITLTMPVRDYRLVAKFDLLILKSDGSWVILDWKTSKNHPKRKWLADRLQTHVYPYVLAHAGGEINAGHQVDPDQIELIYWFTNQPEQPEPFKYSLSAYKADAEYLEGLMSAISQKSEDIFPLTPDVRRCLFCTYRSLCNRGVKPGSLMNMEEWQESEPSAENVSIDVDQVEIEF